MTIKDKILNTVFQLPGWHTNRKIIVIESDDWGSIRMPSKEAFEALVKAGLPVNKSFYNTYDTLETGADIEKLYNVLGSHRDKFGNPVKFTFNTVMGNPDFTTIAESGYQTYSYRHFYDSYQDYNGEDLRSLWRKGMDENIITPQFHAREHLNTSLWMRALQQGHEPTHLAFRHHFFGLKTKTPSARQSNYLAAFYTEGEQDLEEKKRVVADGLKVFKETFGFESRSFIACNYVWSPKLESVLKDSGVRYLQGLRAQLSPEGSKITTKYNYAGKQNRHGQVYLMRNAMFEPSADPSRDWVASCLAEMATAFRYNKPAVLSSHRINYVSGLSEQNSGRGLKLLDDLLKAACRRWSNIEFMSSDELGDLIKNEKNSHT